MSVNFRAVVAVCNATYFLGFMKRCANP